MQDQSDQIYPESQKKTPPSDQYSTQSQSRGDSSQVLDTPQEAESQLGKGKGRGVWMHEKITCIEPLKRGANNYLLKKQNLEQQSHSRINYSQNILDLVTTPSKKIDGTQERKIETEKKRNNLDRNPEQISNCQKLEGNQGELVQDDQINLPYHLSAQRNKDVFSVLQKANNNKLYQTMRAYNIKKAKKKSVSNASSNNNGEELQDQEGTGSINGNTHCNTCDNESLTKTEQKSPTRGESTNMTNTSQSLRSNDKIQLKAHQIAEEFPKVASKNQSKRVPLQVSTIGQNYLKFPPGFFGEDPATMIDGRVSRKKSNERVQIIDSILKQNSPTTSNDSKASKVLTKLQLQKVASEPYLSKFQQNVVGNRGLPPVLRTKKKFQTEIADENTLIGSKFGGSNLRVMKLAQIREISQRQANRAFSNDHAKELKAENRQLTAPNPVEEIQIKKMQPRQNCKEAFPKVIKEVFPGMQVQGRNLGKIDMKKGSGNFVMKQSSSLVQAIEKNKFLSKIQDQKCQFPLRQKELAPESNKVSQDRLIQIKPEQVLKNVVKQDLAEEQFQDLIKHNSQVSKLLQPSPSKQFLKPISLSKKSTSKTSNGKNSGQTETNDLLKGFKVLESQQSLPQTMMKQQSMSALSGNEALQKKISFSKQSDNKRQVSPNNNESVASNYEEVEMTFGLIGTQHINSNGSVGSMQNSQYQFQFGSTFRQSFNQNGNGSQAQKLGFSKVVQD